MISIKNFLHIYNIYISCVSKFITNAENLQFTLRVLLYIFSTGSEFWNTINAYVIDVSLFVCNDDIYGFIMVPLENDETIAEDMQRLINTKVEMLGKLASVKEEA